ncbi:transcriptional regulator [Kibdelosporangium persicum]|uniref:transcriptional regulator n=1 Tax=Kibdelosporangium persicum TaxID=2698649 RepID=UPI00156709E5|nr:transcriptional regulator [Kibdelosporangium persicum]
MDERQVRRYTTSSAGPRIARATKIPIDELAGSTTRHRELSGEWWACWQTWNEGDETLNTHKIRMRQQGDTVEVTTPMRGVAPLGAGGHLWHAEMRLWDNEILMGWHIADQEPIRSKGTVYFVIDPLGTYMTGRWVGRDHGGSIVTGWGAIAKTGDDALDLVIELMENER